MADYKHGKIYKIVSPSTGLTYYGATTQTLEERFKKHEYNLESKRYQSFLVLECGDAEIELVENYPCNSKKELDRREGYYQRNNECVNIIVAGRTTSEYWQDNKEKMHKKQKEWREANIEYRREYEKNYREKNKEKERARKKKWVEANKEKETARQKASYLKHKERYRTIVSATADQFDFDIKKAASKALQVVTIPRLTAALNLVTADSSIAETYDFSRQQYHVGSHTTLTHHSTLLRPLPGIRNPSGGYLLHFALSPARSSRM